MVIFKCPYCRTEYEMTMARLSSKQRSYAKCQVCHQTMYSWNSRNVFSPSIRADEFSVRTDFCDPRSPFLMLPFGPCQRAVIVSCQRAGHLWRFFAGPAPGDNREPNKTS